AVLQRFLDDRRVRARRPGVVQHCWRWCRRKPAAAALVAALALLAFGAMGAFFWYVEDQAQRGAERLQKAARLESGVEAALGEAGALEKQAYAARDNPAQWQAPPAPAPSAVARAEMLLQGEEGLTPAGLQERVRRLRAALDAEEKDRRMVAQLDEIILEFLGLDTQRSGFTWLTVLTEFRKEFAKYGIPVGQMPPEKAATLIASRPEPAAGRLVAGLDRWIWVAEYDPAMEKDRRWLREVVDAADPDPWRKKVRAATGRRDRQGLEALAQKVDVARQPPQALVLLGYALADVEARAETIALLTGAQRQYPGDFW